MSEPVEEYAITNQVHINHLGPDGVVTPGWNLTVRDNATQINVPVFVPDIHYNAENARTLILAKLGHVRSVHNLRN